MIARLESTGDTFEIEENNTLPLLDVLVKEESHSLSTSLYRKKTFTGLYTDFASVAPIKYKTNLVSVRVYRAFDICSTYQTFHEEMIKVKTILSENCFPKSIVDCMKNNFVLRNLFLTVKRDKLFSFPLLS